MKHIFPYSILTIINIITTDSTLICFTIHKLLQYPKQYYANTFLIFSKVYVPMYISTILQLDHH